MQNMKTALDVGSTFILLIVASAMAINHFADSDSEKHDHYRQWEAANERGLWLGSEDARVVITEFVDFQCPFCARLAPRLDSIRGMFPQDVAVVLHHYPLRTHPEAMTAAIAVECAHRQGRVEPYIQSLFLVQETLESEPWSSLARGAGVPDLEVFRRCLQLPQDSFPRIQAGLSLAREAGIRATPTLWVNGTRSSARNLTQSVEDALN